MNLVKIQYITNTPDWEASMNEIDHLEFLYHRNGQTYQSLELFKTNSNTVTSYAISLEIDSYNSKNDSPAIEKQKAILKNNFNIEIVFEIIDKFENETCNCKINKDIIVVFGEYDCFPIRCLNCCKRVPAYRALKNNDQIKMKLLSINNQYFYRDQLNFIGVEGLSTEFPYFIPDKGFWSELFEIQTNYSNNYGNMYIHMHLPESGNNGLCWKCFSFLEPIIFDNQSCSICTQCKIISEFS